MLFACWRSIILSAGGLLWLFYSIGHYQLPLLAPNLPPKSENSLMVMTYNRGQGADATLRRTAQEIRPDLVALQDAGRRLPRLLALPEFSEHHFYSESGEFTLLSRWPILENESLVMVDQAATKGARVVGVRTILDWHGRRIVVYNLHLPTPRDLLYWYGKRGTFLYGILGVIPGTSMHERHLQYLAPWKARSDWLEQLSVRIKAETLPVLMMGDLNFPPCGVGYGHLRLVLQDSHTSAGVGFGHTFPGNSKSRWVAPWIRIDQVMASGEWQILNSRVRSSEKSQHLPLAVMLKYTEINKKLGLD
jgi:endonuclease/exonuclease/phosphatase (EEP) superfamily protein YafD